jgi:hypothetical protein
MHVPLILKESLNDRFLVPCVRDERRDSRKNKHAFLHNKVYRFPCASKDHLIERPNGDNTAEE